MSKLKLNLTKEQLNAETLDYIKDDTVYVYPLKLSITSNINFEDLNNSEVTEEPIYPANIFVLQKSGTAFDPNQGDMFVKIATVLDMFELPNAENFEAMNSASENEQIPYYRVNSVELACRNQDHATSLFNKIKSELKIFINNYNIQNSTETDQETLTLD